MKVRRRRIRLRLSASARQVGAAGRGEWGSDACWVVERAPALYFKFPKPKPGGGSLWDFAATTCLFKEFGLPATDIHGQPLMLNPGPKTKGGPFMNHRGVLFASDPELAAAFGAMDHA